LVVAYFCVTLHSDAAVRHSAVSIAATLLRIGCCWNSACRLPSNRIW